MKEVWGRISRFFFCGEGELFWAADTKREKKRGTLTMGGGKDTVLGKKASFASYSLRVREGGKILIHK